MTMFARDCFKTRTAGLLVIAAALMLPRRAAAHPGQSLGLKISIADEAINYELLVSADYLKELIPAERDKLKLEPEGGRFRFLDPQQEQAERRTFDGFFKDKNPLTVDGVLVKPILTEAAYVVALSLDPGIDGALLPPDLRVILTYPVKGRPKQVSMVWELYPQDRGRVVFGLDAAVEVLAELDAYDENKLIVFTREEPEIIWHAPGGPVRPKVMPVVVGAKPSTMGLPLLALLVAGACGAGLIGLRRSGHWRGLRYPALALAAVAVATAGYHRSVWAVEVQLPWSAGAQVPDAAEAIDVFTSLHRNVYRAFDYKSESDIYDVLAQSVNGELLDQVYNEVYQSLIMRDQGGAVARVGSVDVLEAELESAGVQRGSHAVAFRVRSRWRVHGAVYHWGHVHARTNEYEALYAIAQREGRWRITGVEVLAQQRLVAEEAGVPETELYSGGGGEP